MPDGLDSCGFSVKIFGLHGVQVCKVPSAAAFAQKLACMPSEPVERASPSRKLQPDLLV